MNFEDIINDVDLETVEGLRYISNSPAPEYGGFHTETVKIAQGALILIEKLWQKLTAALKDRDKELTVASVLEMVDEIPCPDDCENKRGRHCVISANHCIRQAMDYYKKPQPPQGE